MDLEFIRGDTQYIKFQLKDYNGDLLTLGDKDKLYFTVKQNQNSNKILIQKKFPNDIEYSEGYFIFEITSQDTANMPYGTYQYDIELKSGEFVRTLCLGTITLTDEITFRGDE